MIRPRYHLLLLCYTLSGIVSLSYEVLWARMLSLQFGVSIFGVVVTVAAFMLGLGLGSLVGTGLAARCRRPLRLFALLEAGVALYALLLPLLFKGADHWLTLMAADAGISSWLLLQGMTLLILMLLPAVAMGLAFPLILRCLDHVPGSLPLLYGLNACGGAVGAIMPLLLLPSLGWTLSLQVTAMLGMAIAALALWLARGWGLPSEPRATATMAMARLALTWPALLSYAGIGAAALMLQIGWTRLFGMVMLRTEYVLAVILAVFLLGIGAGSLLARGLRGPHWLMILPCSAALFGAATLWSLTPMSVWIEQTQFDSLLAALLWQGGALALVTLPVTIVFGAWLPLLVRQVSGTDTRQATVAAGLYGANAIGAAMGALLAGFVLLPWLGTMQTMILALVLLFTCGLYWAPQRRWLWLGLPLLLLLVWPLRQLPPVSELLPQAQAGSRDLYRFEDAVAITHVLEQADGQRLLLSDLQRMDASTESAAVALQQNQARLPLLLHGSPTSVLFLGLGTGITASGSLALPRLERTAVELSQGAIIAARDWFSEVNGGVMAVMTVVHHDGRHFLSSSQQSFDVIIGDVFHPDMVGRSALLSVQQFERARARLNGQGWFVQWLALNQFDVHNLKVVLRTFQRVFPDMVLYVDGFRLAMAGQSFSRELVQGSEKQQGSRQENKVAAQMQLLLAAVNDEAAGVDDHSISGGEGRWTWLGRYWGKPQLVPGVVQQEWSPQIEFSLPQARYRGDIDVTQVLTWLLQQRPDTSQAAVELGVGKDDFRRFERAYMGTELALRSWVARLQGRQADADRLIRFAHRANPRDRWAGMTLADDMLATLPEALQTGLDREEALKAILVVRHDHVETLRSLWQLAIRQGEQTMAANYLRRLRQLAPLDREVREARP